MKLQSVQSILVVCLGNICRSPVGEHALKAAAANAGLSLKIESAGTAGYHNGSAYDSRSRASARTRGLHLQGTSRAVKPSDFKEFDLLLAMDRNNYETLLSRCPEQFKSKIYMYRHFDPDAPHKMMDVEDPYYSPEDNAFDVVTDTCIRTANNLVDIIANN
ncbi:hypothetical protein P9112_004232 [Eukaryota sp. TZLM1-RC]